jgi:DNA modification methylase
MNHGTPVDLSRTRTSTVQLIWNRAAKCCICGDLTESGVKPEYNSRMVYRHDVEEFLYCIPCAAHVFGMDQKTLVKSLNLEQVFHDKRDAERQVKRASFAAAIDDNRIEIIGFETAFQGFPARCARLRIPKLRNVLVSGHLRTKILIESGFIEADCVTVDYDEPTHTARMIAANRLVGQDDEQQVLALLKELDGSMDLAGYDIESFNELLAANPPAQTEVDAEPQIDRAAELAKKWGVERGQVWQLGEHRLMCGDSTGPEDTARLMDKDAASLVVTDPPYGVDYDGGTKRREKLSGDETPNLYFPFLKNIRLYLHDHAAVYLWYADGDAAVTQAVTQAGYEVRSNLIWNKNQAQFGALSTQYKQKHEPFLYCHLKGKAPQWFGPTNEVSVWDVERAKQNEFHPTQKPVELFVRAIKNSSQTSDIVFEGFSGSGTTLIACEQLSRRCRAMEISPGYVAVALQRWADATSKTPVLL